MRGIRAFGGAKIRAARQRTRTHGGDRMSREFIPQAAALLSRRRRIFVVASLPVVLAAVVVSIAGSGAGTSASGAAGIARASATGVSSSVAAARTASPAAGPPGGAGAPAPRAAAPQVTDGNFQGESPAVASLPMLPVVQSPIHTREIESLRP